MAEPILYTFVDNSNVLIESQRFAQMKRKGSSDAVYGTSRMYAALSQQPGRTISVFRTLDEAEGWLAGEQAPQD